MIAVTGATGHLGDLVVQELMARGAVPAEIIAIVRDEKRATELKKRGVQIRVADYTDSAALEKSLAGVSRLLLVSANEVGKRAPQHKNVVDAAKKAHVKLLAYTSILKADTTQMLLAKEHLETEKYILASGLPYVFLRNGWYIENYSAQIPGYLQHGGIAGSGENGKVSAASRRDYAAAAAVALLGKAKTNSIYELAGSTSFTLEELAKTVSGLVGKNLEYKNIPVGDLKQLMIGAGLPEGLAAVLADSDVGIARGELFNESHDLEKLIGHSTAPLETVLRASLK